MEELINIGVSVEELNMMLEKEPLIKDLFLEMVRDKINILGNLGMSYENIMGVIESNPHYLVRTNGEVKNLINRLSSLEFTNISDLIMGNPNILSLDVYEIDEYYNKRLKEENISVLDITLELENMAYLFDEI